VPGERAWPTQPFPSAPPPFSRQTFGVDDLSPYILTVEEREEWKARLAKARFKGIFTPPSLEDTITMPGAHGGANWGTTAANPYDGTVYVLGLNLPSLYKVALEPPRRGGGPAQPASPEVLARGGVVYAEQCATCHGPDRQGTGAGPALIGVASRVSPQAIQQTITGGRAAMPPIELSPSDLTAVTAFLGESASAGADGGRGTPPPRPQLGGPIVASGGAPAGRARPALQEQYMVGPDYPQGVVGADVRYYSGYNMFPLITKPPFATLTAYDLNTGTIKWQIPAGGDDARAAAEGARDTGFIRQRTGIITTSSGLLFHAGGDAKVRAYDTTTGRLLWTAALPAGSQGLSSMYEASGRQYLVVNATLAATAATGATSGGPKGYVAFALRR
jgi:quinoprotein glucose dehydrogenase